MQKDFFHIPPKYSGDVKIYTANTGVNLQGFQMWQKPKGASLVSMTAIAGGGGGGGGFSRAAAADGGGGGGGGCSGIVRFICPAMLLPDTMYIQVGGGGVGGAASGAGTAGISTWVLTSKTAALPNRIVGVNPGGAGGAGTGAAAGAAGAAPSLGVTEPPNTWGQWFATIGLVGFIGGAHTGAVGTDVTCWAALPLSGGAGGAGSTGPNFAGGNQTATALLDIGSQGYYIVAAGGVAKGGTAAGAGVDGSAGVQRITPFFNSGGAGGGSLDAGQAGHGGNGGYGCGGGGGGAGTTGGRGGNGGSGLVIIVTI